MVARIPLYLAAGPSCDVFTNNDTTTRWLTEALLNDEESDLHEDASREPWWLKSEGQSKNGILLKVGTENEEGLGTRNLVTEMLFYAAVAQTDPALPTSPNSSSPTPYHGDVAGIQAGKIAKVYALPLCSNVFGLPKDVMELYPPTLPNVQSTEQAVFLPHTYSSAQVSLPGPPKRQSISVLFEDATKKRRKSKGRGGESISQAMASIDCLPPRQEMWEKQEASQLQQNDLRRKSVSRKSSMAPIAGSEHPRPKSGSGPLAGAKHSSLHRVESLGFPHKTPTLSDAESSYEHQNKAALTKVVMAAMRLHGLQQKKKPSGKSQLPSEEVSYTETSEIEDEYKLVYHQTFKAAIFTFRQYVNTLLISQERMRDVVDRLLVMFCTDPMIADRFPDGSMLREYEAENGVPSSSPFDKPSTQARSTNVASAWNTPTLKKR